MVRVLEEYGGMLLAFSAGVFLIANIIAMGEENGILYQFIVTYCNNAI